jgi:hypothetical protein
MQKTIFLDTNIFLHYRDFDHIDWLSILNIDSALIIIPTITLRELDKNKDSHPRERVRKRARKIIKKLSELFETGLQVQLHDTTEVKLDPREPLIDFAAHQLSPDVQDDHLIASMLTYRIEHPEADMVLVTSDVGLSLRAKAQIQNITTTKLSERLKLPEVPDAEQEKIRLLEEQLLQYQLKMPKLSLAFEDGEQHATFTLPAPILAMQDDIDKKIKEIKVRYPPMATEHMKRNLPDISEKNVEISASLAAALNMSTLQFISAEDIKKYNEDLEIFYQRYTQYFQAEADFHNFERRSIQLSIWLTNDGTAPSEDIDAFIHFPDGFTLFKEGEFPKPPKLPEPPDRPKSQMQKMLEGTSVLASMPYLASERYSRLAPVQPASNVSSPIIKRTNSYDVEIHVQRIKHQLSEPFAYLYVVFDSYEIARSFQLSYEILAADLPHKPEGTLHIIIERDISFQST